MALFLHPLISMRAQEAINIQMAGTGFMIQPLEVLIRLQRLGYTQNLVPCYDHFEVQSGAVRIFPKDFEVDEVTRFENTSDPDDQSILYAISSPSYGFKGVFLESYGLYHEELSQEMLDVLMERNGSSACPSVGSLALEESRRAG